MTSLSIERCSSSQIKDSIMIACAINYDKKAWTKYSLLYDGVSIHYAQLPSSRV